MVCQVKWCLQRQVLSRYCCFSWIPIFSAPLLWFSAHHYYKALGTGFHCLQETLGASGVIGTLGCVMKEQLPGSVTTRLTKCDGHQFVSVELTHAGILRAPLLLRSTLSQCAGKRQRRINREETRSTRSQEYNQSKAEMTEIPYQEQPHRLGLRKYLVRCLCV